ncbi:hypothetical protein GOD96_33345 [Sinorhizobium medicae]|nr:hypothetical protein [Sinorhizobium medicae]
MSRNVDYHANAILIMDQAGCHISNNLLVPENITILLLPPKSPELWRDDQDETAYCRT